MEYPSLQWQKKQVNKKQFLIIFLTAFILRAVIGLSIDSTVSGSYGYRDIASNLLKGAGYFWDYTNNVDTMVVRLTTFRPPLYTLFYTILVLAFGSNSIPYVLIQSLLSAMVPLIAYFVAKEIWSERHAIITGIIATIYPHFLTRAGNVSEDNLYIPFICLSIWGCIRFIKTTNIRYLIICASSISLAILTRQTIISFLPLLLLFIVIYSPNQRLKVTITYSLLVLFIIFPWILFHYSKYGNLSISDSTGRTLWTGNNQFTYDSKFFPYQSIDKIEKKLWRTIPPDSLKYLKTLNTIDQDRYFMRQGIEYINNHPFDFVKSIYLKNLGLFSIFYNPHISTDIDKMAFMRILAHTLAFTPVLLLSIIAFFLNIKNRFVILLLFLLLSFILISWIFWSHTRHAIPYHIVFILLSSDSIYRFCQIKWKLWTK